MVQNKSDLIVPDQIEEYQKKDYLDNFAKKNGFCGTIQCSAKTNQNVEECFQTLLGNFKYNFKMKQLREV